MERSAKSPTQKKAFSWESRTTRHLITVACIIVIVLVLIFAYLLNPVASPIASIHDEEIHDEDRDGYADSDDIFPDDANEWADTDEDGMGDLSYEYA